MQFLWDFYDSSMEFYEFLWGSCLWEPSDIPKIFLWDYDDMSTVILWNSSIILLWDFNGIPAGFPR